MSKLERLKRISFDELRVRGAQALSSFAERRGWSALSRLPTDQNFFALLDRSEASPQLRSADELLTHFRSRTEPSFFSSFSDRESTVAALRTRWPQAENRLIEKADRLLVGRFDLLGLRNLYFGSPIDWQLEPVSGKRAPLVHWSRLNYLDANVIGDKKIVWELNRHQYLSTLGQAYWLTSDERYAKAFVAQLVSWMDHNPPKLGINWASCLEVGFRAISWIWAFHFFKDSAALTSEIFLRALKFLSLHARHLESYLSTYFSPNTHLTGEALALFYLGTMLPEFRAAARWREAGRRILLEQLPRHVLSDGVYFEQSSYYHRYTTDFYTHFLILSLANGESPAPEVAVKLEQLLDHLLYITRPDGTTPFFGDDDGGRLVMLDQRPANDFRASLATGASLFQRGDYKQIAGEAGEETLWLLGTPGLANFDRLTGQAPAQQSVAFADGGYYVMRDGWTPEANYLLLDCGPHGMNNCGHAHADVLAFELAARGKTLLVDPGTYTYTGSKELRDWFRSTAAHNALTVDGESSSVSAGPFSWRSIARAKTEAWISRERFDYFSGKHDGYERLLPPVSHSRSVLFLKHDYWVMRDRLSTAGTHRYDLWFHFDLGSAPGLQFADDFGASVRETSGAGGLTISSFAGKAGWRREDGLISHAYGEGASAPVFVFSSTASGNEDVVTFMVPTDKAEPAKGVGEIEVIGGRAFEVIGESAYDIVMIKTSERVEVSRLAADFEWTWARFAHEGASVPDELVLLGGQRLELEGKQVLCSERRINYLVAKRVGNQYRIETDEGISDLRFQIADFELKN